MKSPASLFRITSLIALGLVLATVVWSQAKSSFQPGTIMAVNAHETSSEGNNKSPGYDVSIKVGNTVYVVLYTPPPGVDIVQYREGTELMVSVDGDILKFNDLLGDTKTVPILNRKEVASKAE